MSIRKEVLKLSIPIVINLVLESVITITDIFVVSKFGANAVSGVGITQSVWGILFAITLVFSSGGKILLTRFYGAKDYKKASIVVSTLLIFVIFFSFALMLIFALLPQVILSIIKASREISNYANNFTYILIFMIPFMLIVTVLDTMLVSKGDSKTPMYLAMIAAIVNVILDLALGLGYFGFESYGVKGVAFATVVSYIINCAILLYIYFMGQKEFIPSFRFNFAVFKRIFKVAYPEAGARLINNLSNLFYSSMIVVLGSSFYAAYTLGLEIVSFGYMPSIALAVSGSILLGQQIGAKNYLKGKKYLYTVLLYNVILMSVLAFIYFAFAQEITELFTKDAKVVQNLTFTLKVFSIMLIPFGIDVTFTFALNAAGLTRKVFKISVSTLWLIKILPAIFAIYILNSYKIVMLLYISQIIIVAILVFKEFQKEEWKSVKV